MRDPQAQACIVGIGATRYSKQATRSPLALAAEAVSAAIADAGVSPSEIDGVVSHAFDPVSEVDLAHCFGWKELRFAAEIAYGNSAGAVGLAGTAATTGQADYVVAFRSISGRYGDSQPPGTASGDLAFYAPFGVRVPAHWVAVVAQRYLHEYGADPRAFGWISVVCRKHGATNPFAVNYQQPITIEDHQSSRMVASPLRLYDCTPNTEGACAVVVTTADRARDLPNAPVSILDYAQGTGTNTENNTNYNRERIMYAEESALMAEGLYERTGLGPGDIHVVQIYDHFTPLVLTGLEAWGFCGIGEGAAFVEGGERISIGGPAPLNTSGGHLGEAYVQTMNHIAEAVRQLRGTAVNQVQGAEVALVVSGVGLPSSALLLVA